MIIDKRVISVLIIGLISLCACQSVAFLYYGVRKPHPVSSKKIEQKAVGLGIDTNLLYSIRPEHYPELLHEIGSFPNIRTYDSNGLLYNYRESPEECMSGAASFIETLNPAKLSVFILAVIFPALVSAQQIIYVKYDAIGDNNGISWQNAFTQLQPALQNAQYGDQIWVAAGTYLPTVGTDRNSTFFLPKGVSLWGGFNGIESTISQRNISINLTILSGDIGTPGLRADNTFHIVSILGGDNLTIIDGFRIKLGNADGQDDGGILSRNAGGGIIIAANNANPTAAPIIRNCFFEQNRAIKGGGVACIGTGTYACVPDISACTFLQNRAEYSGGSLFKDGINLPESAFLFRRPARNNRYTGCKFFLL